MASPGFAVIDSDPMPAVEPFPVCSTPLRTRWLAAAKQWERHLVEVRRLPPGAAAGTTARLEYDRPSTASRPGSGQSRRAGRHSRTIESRRAATSAAGFGPGRSGGSARLGSDRPADARLVDALREVIDAETDTSTGTRSRLMRRVVKRVEENSMALGRCRCPDARRSRPDGPAHTGSTPSARRSPAGDSNGRPGMSRRRSPPGPANRSRSTPPDRRVVLLDDGLPVRAT